MALVPKCDQSPRRNSGSEFWTHSIPPTWNRTCLLLSLCPSILHYPCFRESWKCAVLETNIPRPCPNLSVPHVFQLIQCLKSVLKFRAYIMLVNRQRLETSKLGTIGRRVSGTPTGPPKKRKKAKSGANSGEVRFVVWARSLKQRLRRPSDQFEQVCLSWIAAGHLSSMLTCLECHADKGCPLSEGVCYSCTGLVLTFLTNWDATLWLEASLGPRMKEM